MQPCNIHSQLIVCLQAAVRVSGLELGGLVGSLIAGRWSDALIRNDTSGKGGAVGKRVQVCARVCSLGGGQVLRCVDIT
jgi:hypothetical protein